MSASSRSWQPNKNARVSKKRKCNDRYFVIVRHFRNLIKIVMYRNVAFTDANSQADITDLKQRHAIFLCTGL